MTDILTGTPPELTYLHPLVREAWTVVWAVASGVLVLILGWMGLSLIMQHHLGQTQNGWREMVPRLVLGLVAAATSLWWCALIIDVADAVSGFIAASLGVTAGDLLRTTLRTLLTAVEAGSVGVGMAIVMALLYMVYGFFVLYVLVQMILAPKRSPGEPGRPRHRRPPRAIPDRRAAQGLRSAPQPAEEGRRPHLERPRAGSGGGQEAAIQIGGQR